MRWDFFKSLMVSLTLYSLQECGTSFRLTSGSSSGFPVSFPLIVALIAQVRESIWGFFPLLSMSIPVMQPRAGVIITGGCGDPLEPQKNGAELKLSLCKFLLWLVECKLLWWKLPFLLETGLMNPGIKRWTRKWHYSLVPLVTQQQNHCLLSLRSDALLT